MDRSRLPPLVGIVASLLVVCLLGAPYALVRTSPGTAVATYYGTGAFNPLFTGLFALVLAMVLAAGFQRRADPALVAGIGLALGTLIFLVIALWATTVPREVVVGMDAPTIMADHRWILAACALVTPLASLVWARTMRIF
jgi:hypothetical protein